MAALIIGLFMNTIPGRTIEIELFFPYTTVTGKEIKKIFMRSPTVRDRLIHKKSTKNEEDADLDMIASLCDLEAEDFYNMDACDYFQLEACFNDFLLPPAKRAKKQ